MALEHLIILSLIQGITEFLPVSSSAHLNIVNGVSENINQSVSIDLSLHIGSLVALVIYFSRNRIKLNKILNTGGYQFIDRKSLLLLFLFSAVPTVILAFILLTTNFIDNLRGNLSIIAWFNLIFALILLVSDTLGEKTLKYFRNKDILTLAIFQSIALIPGVSRSGICLTLSRFLGYSRSQSTFIASFMSLPILLFGIIYTIYLVIQLMELELTISILLSIIISFVASYLSLKLLIEHIEKIRIYPFVIYRVILSFWILIILV
tara:strand:- start:99753 stop:100544 length:792 start_codon:yes stop_codon:yes gene_type:complete